MNMNIHLVFLLITHTHSQDFSWNFIVINFSIGLFRSPVLLLLFPEIDYAVYSDFIFNMQFDFEGFGLKLKDFTIGANCDNIFYFQVVSGSTL